MRNKIFLGIAAAALMASSPAISATVDFTNGTNGANGFFEDPTFAVGNGVTVTVSAGTYLADTIVDTDVDGFLDLVVSKTNAGLGVALDLLPVFPDLNGPLDLLTFAFSSAVSLNSLTFGNVDANDDFDIFFDGVLAANDVGISGANPALFGGVELTEFSVGADQVSLFFGSDDFTVAGFDVSIAAVPLPAGLPLLLAGLGGMIAVRRKRR